MAETAIVGILRRLEHAQRAGCSVSVVVRPEKDGGGFDAKAGYNAWATGNTYHATPEHALAHLTELYFSEPSGTYVVEKPDIPAMLREFLTDACVLAGMEAEDFTALERWTTLKSALLEVFHAHIPNGIGEIEYPTTGADGDTDTPDGNDLGIRPGRTLAPRPYR
jgi:hypothetical protein